MATLCSKKLDHDLANIGIQKAKIDLLAYAQNAHKAEEHQICLLQLQLQMRQAEQADAGGFRAGPNLPQGLSQIVPADPV